MRETAFTSEEKLTGFTGTDPESSVEDYLNTVTAKKHNSMKPRTCNLQKPHNFRHGYTSNTQTHHTKF